MKHFIFLTSDTKIVLASGAVCLWSSSNSVAGWLIDVVRSFCAGQAHLLVRRLSLNGLVCICLVVVHCSCVVGSRSSLGKFWGHAELLVLRVASYVSFCVSAHSCQVLIRSYLIRLWNLLINIWVNLFKLWCLPTSLPCHLNLGTLMRTVIYTDVLLLQVHRVCY